jgi:hypothetical protein
MAEFFLVIIYCYPAIKPLIRKLVAKAIMA